MSGNDSPPESTDRGQKRKCLHSDVPFLSPQCNALMEEFGSMETSEEKSATLQKNLVDYIYYVAGEMLTEVTEKTICLEDVVEEQNKTIDKLKAECGEYKNALKLKKTEIELLRKSVACSSSCEEMTKNGGILHECYKRCSQENSQLTWEVEQLKIKLESCQDQSRINEKNLRDENEELKTNLCDMEGNLDQLSRTLEVKSEEMQDMEAFNKVLVAKELKANDVLQEARKKLISGLQDFSSDGSIIGIKRMGELDEKPFQEVYRQKFPGEEDWSMKSMELCSKWQEEVKNPLWFPFKMIPSMDKHDEIIDDDDDDLKNLKNEWGDQVHKAVCVALKEVNEYNPNARYAVPEFWNFKEGRKAEMKEVIKYLLTLLKDPPKKKMTLRRSG